MRTTLDIADDVLQAAKERARREGKTAGEVISDLARRALTAPSARSSQTDRGVVTDFDRSPGAGPSSTTSSSTNCGQTTRTDALAVRRQRVDRAPGYRPLLSCARHTLVGESDPDGLGLLSGHPERCVRVMSHPGYPNALPVQAVMARLGEATARHHECSPDDLSLLDPTISDATRIHGPGHLTDLYLLALAVRYDGRFVTFDAAVPLTAVPGSEDQAPAGPVGPRVAGVPARAAFPGCA